MTPVVYENLLLAQRILTEDVIPYIDMVGQTSPTIDLSPVLSKLLLIQNALTDLSSSIDSLSASICVLKKQNYFTSTLATVSGSIPYDNTIPQITEGVQIMETLFTPSSVSSNLEIDVQVCFKNYPAFGIVIAVFIDNIPNAVITNYDYYTVGNHTKNFSVTVPNTDINQKRISVRIGGDGSSATLNINYPNLFGGSVKSSINVMEFINV